MTTTSRRSPTPSPNSPISKSSTSPSNRITVVPESLARLTNLNTLYLGHNGLIAIPEALGKLGGLQELYLHNNRISGVADFVGQLVGLRSLTLGGNQMSAVPDSLAQLTNLERLEFGESEITTIPSFLAHFTNLRSLQLPQNQITAIPDSLARLVNLETLSLGQNQITTIPDSLGQLANLKDLFLDDNRISAIPDSLTQLDLRGLRLGGNQITAIPDSFARLSNLEALDLDNNPLPEELLAALRVGIKTFFRFLKSTATRRVYPRTVRLVLLGEPKSGKTTLLEALQGNLQPCDESRKETIGVNVVTIERPHPADREPMYLSAWDFVGQHAAGKLSSALGEKAEPALIDIETRHLLERLIEHLDSQRSVTEPHNGGLHPCRVDDGRWLWLCPDHLKLYRGRS